MAVDAGQPAKGIGAASSLRRWKLVSFADVGVAALVFGALVFAAQVPRLATHAGAATSALRIVALLVACLAVAFRQGFPRGALIVATAAAGVSDVLGGPPQVAVAVAFAAYSAARLGDYSGWWAPPAGVSLVIGASVTVGQVPNWLAVATACVALVCVGWFAGQTAKERRIRLDTAAERQTDLARQRLADLRQAAIDERLVIARELHDIVAHAMSVIAVRAGVARMVMDSDPAEVKEALGIIETTTRRALQEMRLLVEVLRHTDGADAELSPQPGIADVQSLLDEIRRAGVAVDLKVDGNQRTLPAGVNLSAYRIVQEALTNVVRHAGPTTATLLIGYRPDQLLLELTDAGRTDRTSRPAEATGAGHGLIGMRERVALYDGDLVAGPRGNGFHVRALLRTDQEPL